MNFTIRLGDFKSTPEHRKVVLDVLESGRITEGPYTRMLEEDWAQYVGVKHAIACANGTLGLMLVLQALKILYDKSLKFVVPATTFPATLNAVLLTGHQSVLADVGSDMLINLDEEKIREQKIDGIIPVHLLGYPCDMDRIMELKEKYGLFVLEDACESSGTTYKDKMVGSIGDAGVFSMFMGHTVGVGELGIITTNNDKLVEVIRSIKNHGRIGSNLMFNHQYVGTNAKTTEFMSAMACVEIKRLPMTVTRRRLVAGMYYDLITNPRLFKGEFSEDCTYLGYPLVADTAEYKGEICTKLNENGIETRGMFPCLATQPAYGMRNTKEEIMAKTPNSFTLEEKGFYIPCHQYLKPEEIEKVISVLNDG